MTLTASVAELLKKRGAVFGRRLESSKPRAKKNGHLTVSCEHATDRDTHLTELVGLRYIANSASLHRPPSSSSCCAKLIYTIEHQKLASIPDINEDSDIAQLWTSTRKELGEDTHWRR